MSDNTKIQWADATWNPITGCTKISAGCKNCYAAELHDRRHRAYLQGAKLPAQYAKPFSEIQLHDDRLGMPLHWKKPRRVFVNSTSDLFHEDVPDGFIFGAFMRMAKAQQHTFIILTKRADRMQRWITERWMTDLDGKYHPDLVLDNVWLLVSVENQDAADLRIPYLLQTPAAVRGVSCEPLLGAVDLKLYDSVFVSGEQQYKADCLRWVIVGGESGPNARPMHPDWARSLRDQCAGSGVSFFFKQWGEWYPAAAQYDDIDFMDKMDFGTHCICLGNRGTKFREEWGDKEEYWCGYQPDPAQNPWFMERIGKKAAGRLLDGRTWDEYPEGAKK